MGRVLGWGGACGEKLTFVVFSVVLGWRAEEGQGVWREGDLEEHGGHRGEAVEGDRWSVQRNKQGEDRAEGAGRERRERGQEERT